MWRATLLVLLAGQAAADTMIAAHTLRAQSVIGAEDLSSIAIAVPGALTDPAEAIGREARVVLYAGRPIQPGDIGPPALVDRNQLVSLIFHSGELNILAEGRALARGGAGDAIRVMNTASHSTVTGVVAPDGTVVVGGAP
ncbi:MAG: flagellar basal body P-ring formation protein FlgA [Rhodobacteraceae bacterium]|nr:flagellar basal body P-ring formation protein FlgA [Paracoccaceae bacterium]